MQQSFNVADAVDKTQWLSVHHLSSLYVWLHIDNLGVPFYAGRGRQADAWDWHGGIAWEYYVRECLGGSYHIVIPAFDLDEYQSQVILASYLVDYGSVLLNQNNPSRGMDYDAYDRRRVLADKIKPMYDQMLNETFIERRIEIAKQALNLQYQINKIQLETGLFGDVIRQMGGFRPVNLFFVKPLIEGLVETGKAEEAKAILVNFLLNAPYNAESPTVKRLQKIADRGTLVRRKPA